MVRRSLLAVASTVASAAVAVGFVVGVAGCESCVPTPEPPSIAEGVFGPLGSIRPNATDAERALFEEGKAIALRQWTPAQGLGPRFNV